MDYQHIYQTVKDVFGLDDALLLHSSRRDCTDARAVLVHTLIGMGYSEGSVSRMTGFSQQRVNSLKNGFRYRRGYEITNGLQEVHKRILSIQTQ